jgi:hypothetical protein
MTKHEQLTCIKGGKHLEPRTTLQTHYTTISANVISPRRGDDHKLELPTQK